jgi:hypothetical protein
MLKNQIFGYELPLIFNNGVYISGSENIINYFEKNEKEKKEEKYIIYLRKYLKPGII